MFNLRHKALHLFKRLPSSSALPFSSLSASDYLNYHLDSFLSNQIPTFQHLSQSHALIITSANSNNIFICAKLISLYASLSKPTSSTKVFASVSPKDTFLWNSIIKTHFSNGGYSKALVLFFQMRASGFAPNQFTLPMVVSSCAELMVLDHGNNVHGLGKKLGLFAINSAVGSSFVYMYSKCGRMKDASIMFDEITVRDVVCWTALIIGYVHNDESEKGLECLCEMHRIGGIGERPNFRTLEVGLQACGYLGALAEGRCLHGFVVKRGIGCSGAVKSLLLSMYSRCGRPEESYLSFCDVENKDVISWTSVIGVYARSGLMDECLSLFWEMQESDIFPDEIVVSCMLSGFRNSTNINEGKAFLGLVTRQNYASSQMVHSELLSMYCKFELLTLAEKLFSGMQHQNKESCNTMIYGYGKLGLHTKCIQLFRKMRHQGIEADSNSLVSVVSSCFQMGAIYLGRSLHCFIIKVCMDENVSVANSLLDMYGKSGYLTIARRIFSVTQKDIITWNSLISSYTHNGHSFEAIDLYHKMIAENFMPNSATVVTVLSACSHLSSLEEGKKVHCHIKERRIGNNLSLATALVDMYAKCGELEKSRELFNSMEDRDVISWNVMISGYATHGRAESAIELFHEMEDSNVKPNELTFLALLSACNHSGLVEEGKYLFRRMQDLSLNPNLKHYACMVDILGRSGNLQEAEDLVLSMPISPDGGVWGSLLGACKIHNEIELGVRVARHAIKSDPENDGYYIMLSNLYSSIGKWEEAINVRKMMEEKGVGMTKSWSVV
ncbi:pentatricopeptide repeat-containing protein At4g39952, mitochondrial [Pyrus x bretschneideri]|uniref:pentatricopeptide repeat-containing protein At4g39952, mitochondrial n=1 Tax=Pyrus x bretschneideri TaxID=225117 RepID=UPI00202ED623|nr:pentatricopeptide repeat-containing protein At4g39952, mitochondrial [Pyrus x bretschneideri]XP_018506092.2 pentatricopeptide repeat-containing protein At4g39952, mitochondrial [Pyrus x bretschneideri]XP_048427182.1 pentatricopeptide repeat-containing protein At4g39952, mitochondrial [Pyrus x bretschneideri]XP_048427189.1 pentatricopeptide repeat-containing protein At4g39952, mitochondrial [Pyrus x bretschneideri]